MSTKRVQQFPVYSKLYSETELGNEQPSSTKDKTRVRYKRRSVGHGGSVVSSVPCIRRFESHTSHHVGTLGMSFTHSCLWSFGLLTPAQNQCCSRERL